MVAYEKARAIYQKLADANPAVTGFQLALADTNNFTGVALEWAKPAEALAAFERSRAIQQKLADASPSVTEIQVHLATSHSNVGVMLARQKRFAEAFAALDRSVVLMQRLADNDPDKPAYKRSVGYNRAVRGWARARAGQTAEAAADMRRALELLTKDKTLGSQDRFQRSLALAVLAGLGGDAKSGVTSAEAAAFADQAVAALRDAVPPAGASTTS
jgi:tetratricopeptide (TPR) repeat protein